MSTIPELAHLDAQRIRIHILNRFLSAQDDFLSGGSLADDLGMTRTAIWKHIRALEELGFEFEAAPRRGYRITHIPNLVMEPMLKPCLKSHNQLGTTVLWFPTVASTNALANEFARHSEIPHGSVVTAVKQEGGRGRQGRKWSSPAGGLWMSIILRKSFALVRAAELTLLASIAIARAVEQVAGLRLDIKWPNDLLYNGKKVCGILAELRAGGESVQHAILGIGLNSNVTLGDIPADIQQIATSLFIESGREVNQAALAGAILTEFEALYESLVAEGSGFSVVADEWRQRCVTLGKQVQVQTPQGLVSGLAAHVDERGVLFLVSDDGQQIPIHSGDVLF